jgi:hypothetical protein
MKVCPVCQKTYSDDNLNFCLEDGTVLNQAASHDAPPPTVMMNNPPITSPRTTFGNQPPTQSSWNNPAGSQYATPPKKSRTWLWVLGILAVLVLVCGGGGIALVALVYNLPPENTNTNGNRIVTTNKNSTIPTNTTKTGDKNTESVDLSTWVKDFSAYGNTEFTDGEFRMSSKQKDFYYVLVAPDDYSTTGANTSVIVRNVDDAVSSMGYGLIFHSNPSPLTQDYAFLIDTKKKKFRVVRHEPSKEMSVVAWTNSPVIKDGSQENKLEVRDKGDTTELYINDQMVTTIKNTYAYKNGVPGLYSGDGTKAGFKDLKITK